MRLLITLLFGTAAAGADCTVASYFDRSYTIGSSSSGGAYSWTVNGKPAGQGPSPQLLRLRADGGAAATDGRAPAQADGVGYAPGRWGSAFSIAAKGTLAYTRAGAIDFNEGTIEMWVAPRASGADALYTSRDQTLFYYKAANGDTMAIAQSHTAGIVYAGGTVRGQWESAYGSRGNMRSWNAGEWHHLAFTFSAAGNFMRFYVDGVPAADTNEKHYWPPEASGDRIQIGGSGNTPADFAIDEVRILGRAMTAAEVRASASRLDAPADNEVWLDAATLAKGDTIVFRAGECTAEAYTWRGVPLTGADPPSTLLASGATSIGFSVQSDTNTVCGYAVNRAVDLYSMTVFDQDSGTTEHRTTIKGLSADPAQVNKVYVRCLSDPDYALVLQYRAIGNVNPPFPRKGNLWGVSQVCHNGVDGCARLDLFLGASFSPAEIRRLRALNPQILILTSINTVENSGLSEDYYLHDVKGHRIEVWPGTYRLNLTKPYVAEYQARFAYQTILDSGLLVDGCFFDNFFTTQSGLKADMWGNPVQVDANEDGVPDDPAWLDAEWGKGVYLELNTWRKLMPYALASGHLPRPPQPQFASIFNGDSIGFQTSDVIEGKISFATFWDTYNGWFQIGRKPTLMMVESTPQDQISYGYSYSPTKVIPPATLEFARTYYPNMRFGLAATLMQDGYFAHEYGDTWHGNDWWYDELDFSLGYPLGPSRRETVAGISTKNLIDNGDFAQPLAGTWRLNVTSTYGAAANMALESGAARVNITNAGQGVNWHVTFAQFNRTLKGGTRYDFIFSAKADTARTIAASAQKDGGDYRGYGLSKNVAITTAWQTYTATFQATEDATDARLQFFVGTQTGSVWFDNVSLAEHPPDVYRRDFTNGTAILNATTTRQTVTVGPGYARMKGDQAPKHEYIVDDASPAFTSTGAWRAVKYDTGEWTATGPFYHAWNGTCHQLDAGTGTAQWDLDLREDDTYTIDVWWAAAPGSAKWTKRAVFEIVSGGRIVGTATLDQSTGGDQWHTIASVPLAVAGKPFVRVHGEGDGALVGDALHVRSQARYNDGSPAGGVTLEPMDGILLRTVK
jgi:hypothetical protein